MSDTDAAEPAVFDCLVREGVCRLRRPGTRWLSTGHAGGESVGPVAYNVSVPEGWAERDVAEYVADRLDAAGFDEDGPALLTGVSMRHARVARLGPAAALVTAGVSNPAALPADPDERSTDDDSDATPLGTVNVFVGTTRALGPGALENLVAVAAEAKAATLLSRTGFPGTTTDAVVAACDPSGDSAPYSGSATDVGAAARACVRDALLSSLDSRYADGGLPESVAEAEYGAVTDETAAVSRPPGADR